MLLMNYNRAELAKPQQNGGVREVVANYQTTPTQLLVI